MWGCLREGERGEESERELQLRLLKELGNILYNPIKTLCIFQEVSSFIKAILY